MSFKPSTWFITGAARGIGAHTVEAALAAGHNVVATARNNRKPPANPSCDSAQVSVTGSHRCGSSSPILL